MNDRDWTWHVNAVTVPHVRVQDNGQHDLVVVIVAGTGSVNETSSSLVDSLTGIISDIHTFYEFLCIIDPWEASQLKVILTLLLLYYLTMYEHIGYIIITQVLNVYDFLFLELQAGMTLTDRQTDRQKDGRNALQRLLRRSHVVTHVSLNTICSDKIPQLRRRH